jgi:hypothetical protein
MRTELCPNRLHTMTPRNQERRAVVAIAGVMLAVATAGVVAALAADTKTSGKPEELRMWMAVGERRFPVTLADTAAARAFGALLPLTLDMRDLNDNEKHVRLPQALPTNPSRPQTIRNGDIMLYGSDTLVVFYLTFDSQYTYTRIGSVVDPAGLRQALGPRDVRLLFSKN